MVLAAGLGIIRGKKEVKAGNKESEPSEVRLYIRVSWSL